MFKAVSETHQSLYDQCQPTWAIASTGVFCPIYFNLTTCICTQAIETSACTAQVSVYGQL
jgi:hypothetical protein